MTFFNYIFTVIKNFKSNFHCLGKYNFDSVLSSYNKTFYSIRHDLNICKKNLIFLYYDMHKEEGQKVKDELNFIKETEQIETFPYPQIKKISHDIVADFDKRLQLPYVIHKDKRLYFTKDYSVEAAKAAYINFIERENLLGGGYTAKAPHQYQTDNFKINQNDILLDIGCAEALLTLDAIDIVKKAYLFESNPCWYGPLQATFAPYKEKIEFIPKYVTNTNSDSCITLNSIFSKIKGESFFIKMDIEGEEENVITSSQAFLDSPNNIKIACCTYHKPHHAESISNYLKNLNYEVTFSDGYMLFFLDSGISPPYFRKGVLRAWRKHT